MMRIEARRQGKSDNADSIIRAALNAGRSMTFATSQPASWKAHFTKRFPDAKIEEVEGGLRITTKGNGTLKSKFLLKED